MWNFAVTFFVFALIAALLGFTGIAVATAGMAKILFYVFIVLFIITAISHRSKRRNSL